MHPCSRGGLKGKLAGKCLHKSAHDLCAPKKSPRHLQQALQSWQELLGFVQDPCACGKEPVLKVRAVLSTRSHSQQVRYDSLCSCYSTPQPLALPTTTRHSLMTAGKPVTQGALGAAQHKVRPEDKEGAARVNIPVTFYTLMARNSSLKLNSSSNQ